MTINVINNFYGDQVQETLQFTVGVAGEFATIQDAVNHLTENVVRDGQVVELQLLDPVYNIATTIALDSVKLILQGAGVGSTTLQGVGSNIPIFSAKNSWVAIRNLSANGFTSANALIHCINDLNSSNTDPSFLELTDLLVTGMSQDNASGYMSTVVVDVNWICFIQDINMDNNNGNRCFYVSNNSSIYAEGMNTFTNTGDEIFYITNDGFGNIQGSYDFLGANPNTTTTGFVEVTSNSEAVLDVLMVSDFLHLTPASTDTFFIRAFQNSSITATVEIDAERTFQNLHSVLLSQFSSSIDIRFFSNTIENLKCLDCVNFAFSQVSSFITFRQSEHDLEIENCETAFRSNINSDINIFLDPTMTATRSWVLTNNIHNLIATGAARILMFQIDTLLKINLTVLRQDSSDDNSFLLYAYDESIINIRGTIENALIEFKGLSSTAKRMFVVRAVRSSSVFWVDETSMTIESDSGYILTYTADMHGTIDMSGCDITQNVTGVGEAVMCDITFDSNLELSPTNQSIVFSMNLATPPITRAPINIHHNSVCYIRGGVKILLSSNHATAGVGMSRGSVFRLDVLSGVAFDSYFYNNSSAPSGSGIHAYDGAKVYLNAASSSNDIDIAGWGYAGIYGGINSVIRVVRVTSRNNTADGIHLNYNSTLIVSSGITTSNNGSYGVYRSTSNSCHIANAHLIFGSGNSAGLISP